MKVAVIFDRFGPYHIARLEAAARYMEVFPLEISGITSLYQWDKVESEKLNNRITLFTNTESTQLTAAEIQEKLFSTLNTVQPDAVAINGWDGKVAFAALYWCRQHGVPSVVMSESAEEDFKRVWWKELVKRKIVQQHSSGLVGGIRHANYLKKLGMNAKQIFFGYDVVDNQYFATRALQVRQHREALSSEKKITKPYFLVVSRFIEKKNLPFIIKAFIDYEKVAKGDAWHLYFLGDGPIKEELVQLVAGTPVQDKVKFEGFKQYNELPVYFGLAGALLHASTTEQWGLVVNEAMAAGLPVIISERCGCVPELVHQGKNGFRFDPYNQKELTDIMVKFTDGSINVAAMGQESQRIVADFDADLFGKGLLKAVQSARREMKKKMGLGTRYFLKSLLQ